MYEDVFIISLAEYKDKYINSNFDLDNSIDRILKYLIENFL